MLVQSEASDAQHVVQHSYYTSSWYFRHQLTRSTPHLLVRLQVWNFVVQDAEFTLHMPGKSPHIMVDVPKLHVVALDQKSLDPSKPGNA